MAAAPVSRLDDWHYPGAHRLACWFRDRPFLSDALFAALLVGLSLMGLLFTEAEGSERPADRWGIALVVAASGALAWRRRAPVPTLAVSVAATTAFWIANYTTSFDAAVLVALYSTMAHEPSRRRAWIASGAASITLTVVVTLGIASETEDVGFGTLVGVLMVATVAMVLGDNLRHRRAYLDELRVRAERAEADRAEESRRAVDGERNRIARELHDVVAHSVSVMVVQAAAARRTLARDPDAAATALENIETTGRASLAEMRRILGVLRDGDRELSLAPQPTLDDFALLRQQCADAGLPVDLRVEGDERPLGPGVELAVFRIVQEALTNVLKHAGPAAAMVWLRYGPSALEVEIVDDGRGAAAMPAGGAGQGLVGMRERVELYGGAVSAGPNPGGGWRVQATIPLEAGVAGAVGTAR